MPDTLTAVINGSTLKDIRETALAIGHAFFGEDEHLLVKVDARASQTPDGQIRTFIADVEIVSDVDF